MLPIDAHMAALASVFGRLRVDSSAAMVEHPLHRGAARRWSWAVIAVLLAAHMLPFVRFPMIIGGDEPHYARAAYSIAIDGDLDLVNNYREVAEGSNAAGKRYAGVELDHHIRERYGRQVFMHPVGLPVMMAPFVWLQQRVAPGSPPDQLLIGASLALTFAAVLAGWWAVRRGTGDPSLSALVVLGLYFSTPLWFYSRTFFTEPYIWSFVVLGLAGIAGSRYLAAGAALGLAFLMKDTAALIVVPTMGFVLLRYGPRRTVLLAVGPAAAFGVFMVKNTLMYGAPFATFQAFQMGSILRGAAGLVVDPEHGTLWFAPVLVVAAAGWVRASNARRMPASVSAASLIIVAGTFGLTALWHGWTGGACYGPRLLVPVMPFFAVPLIVLWRRSRRAGRWIVIAAMLVGITVQVCAASDPDLAFWSVRIGDLLLEHWWARLLGVAAGALLLWRLVPGRGVGSTAEQGSPETG
jgi:hypothetical protein